MDLADFRLKFPEFADATAYPDAMISFWSGIAEAQVSECKWGNLYTQGVMLYTAHELVLARQSEKAALKGGDAGQVKGPVASKAVGQANISYDTTSGVETNAGMWNLTTYGRQYIRLARMFGAGAVQL